MKVKDVNVSVYRIPTETPESDGTLEWNETIMVLAEVQAGESVGLGMTYGDQSVGILIDQVLKKQVIGENPMDVPAIWERMLRRTRNYGRPGIVSMAVSAVDSALWDLKAKLLKVPLITLLGKVKDTLPAYGSGGFTSFSLPQLADHCAYWMEMGLTMLKIKIGRDPVTDRRRVKTAREAIGPVGKIFVDANGAYTVRQALELAEVFKEYRVQWFEEPVSSDNLAGLNFIRQHVPAGMEVTAGEYGYDLFYFKRMLQAEAVDVLQADATRCAGITGFMKAAVLCEAFGVPLSAHTAPTLHLHPCCALSSVVHLEYFFDHVQIERKFFDGFPWPDRQGNLRPDLSRWGMGVELKRSDVGPYRL